MRMRKCVAPDLLCEYARREYPVTREDHYNKCVRKKTKTSPPLNNVLYTLIIPSSEFQVGVTAAGADPRVITAVKVALCAALLCSAAPWDASWVGCRRDAHFCREEPPSKGLGGRRGGCLRWAGRLTAWLYYCESVNNVWHRVNAGQKCYCMWS